MLKSHLGKNGEAPFDYVRDGNDTQPPGWFLDFLEGFDAERPFFAWVGFHVPRRGCGGENGADKVNDYTKEEVPYVLMDTKDTSKDLADYHDGISRLMPTWGRCYGG